MYPGRTCDHRCSGYPCVLDKGHEDDHVSCNGKLRWHHPDGLDNEICCPGDVEGYCTCDAQVLLDEVSYTSRYYTPIQMGDTIYIVSSLGATVTRCHSWEEAEKAMRQLDAEQDSFQRDLKGRITGSAAQSNKDLPCTATTDGKCPWGNKCAGECRGV